MDNLDRNSSSYLSLSLSTNTLASYDTALRSFSIFCAQDRTVPFPLAERTLIRYICFLARRIKYSSIKIYLSGIRFHSLIRGYKADIDSMHKLYYVLRGIRRHHSQIYLSLQKAPILRSDLSIFYDVVSFKLSHHNGSMLQTAMSFAFYGMLRVSEFTSLSRRSFDPASTLLISDVSLIGTILFLRIKASKTDPFRQGTCIRLPQLHNTRTCPVSAYIRYSAFLSCNEERPFFTFHNGTFLTRRYLSHFIQSCFPNSNINTHSFRIGGASLAATAGLPDSAIQILGRWRSDAFLRYIRLSDDYINDLYNQISSFYHQ